MEKARTRTFRTGTSKNSGVTLLELLIALCIVTFFLALVYPSFEVRGGSSQGEAKRLAAVLRYLNDSAMNRKTTYEMAIALNSGEITYDSPEGKRKEAFSFLEKVYVNSRGEVRTGSLKIFFSPYGLAEIFRATFRTKEKSVTVTYNPYSKRVKVEEEEESGTHPEESSDTSL